MTLALESAGVKKTKNLDIFGQKVQKLCNILRVHMCGMTYPCVSRTLCSPALLAVLHCVFHACNITPSHSLFAVQRHWVYFIAHSYACKAVVATISRLLYRSLLKKSPTKETYWVYFIARSYVCKAMHKALHYCHARGVLSICVT